MKKKVIAVIVSFLLTGICYADDAKNTGKKEVVLNLIKSPLKAIFAPIEGDGLVDLITAPAEMLLSPVIDLGEIVVTPGRTQEYVYNINKNVSVITAEDIKYASFRDVQRSVSRRSGIVLNGFFGNVKDNSIDMRGFGEAGLLNHVVLIDGRRTNQIDMSGADLSQIDINSIDKIEVIKGANSVLYGDNATGGVINIITKKGGTPDKIECVEEFGSYQHYKEYVSAEGGHDFLDYFCSYSWQDTEGYRLNNGYEANDIFGSVTIKPSDHMDVHFSSSYHRDWYGQPGALYDGNIRSDGRTGSRFPDSKVKTEDYYFTADPRIFGQIEDHEGVFSSFVSYRSRRSNSRDVGFNIYESNHHIKSLELKPKLEVNSLLFEDSVENKLVCGVDYFHAKDQVLNGDIVLAKSQLDIIKNTFGIYAADNMLIDKRYIVNAGVRGEWAKYIFDQFQPAASENTQSFKEAAFDAGLGYKYNEKSQIYVNFARSYRYPATDEFFQSAYETFDWWTSSIMVFPAVLNADLKQQVANNYEVGIKDNSFDLLNVNASYYLIDNKNEIYYDPITFQNENYHHTVHHGLEIETYANILDRVDAFFAYTFQKAFFVSGKFASKHIPMVPKHKISAGFDVKPIDGLNINFAVNSVGARYMVSDQLNTLSKLKSHVTLDMGVSYELKNVRIFLNTKNLLDEKYYMNASKNWQGNPAFYPASERSFDAGVAVKF